MAMLRRFLLLLTVCVMVTILLIPAPANAQEEPVVYAVLFYSPSCGHCHHLIENDLPPIQEEFGDQLVVLFINTTEPGGNALYSGAVDEFNIERRVVPLMVVADRVLTGGSQIPGELPGITRQGLQAGGIGLPAIPGLAEAYTQSTGEVVPTYGEESGSSTEPAGPDPLVEEPAADTDPAAQVGADTNLGISTDAPADLDDEQSVWEKLEADPEGNAVAIIVLVALLLSVLVVVYFGWRGDLAQTPYVTYAPLLIAGATLLMLFSIVIEGLEETLPLAMALLGIIFMGAAFGILLSRKFTQFVIPLVALAGLGVAIYLANVEVGDDAAVCGAIGDCNTVQESDYAELFDVLPVGVLGIIGYVAILGIWAFGYFTKEALADAGLLLMALFGVAFSIYLTFLEPFVIGATCAWCITSALTMMLILWQAGPKGFAALKQITRRPKPRRGRRPAHHH